MVTTTDSLITEVEDHLLGGDRDELNELGSGIADSDTTLTLAMDLSGVTEGSYLGLDLEVLYVKSVDSTAKVATVRRGMLGSTAAAHAQGALVYVNPLFSKWQIFKNLNIEISSLSGADNGLYAETAFTLVSSPVQKTYDIPLANNDIRKLLEIRYDAVGAERYWPVVPLRHCQVIRDVTTDTNNVSGLAIRIEESFMPGRSLVVRYAGDFSPLSSTLSDNAAVTTKLGPTMLDIPALGAAARLMGVREAKRTFVERSVDTRRSAEVPAGSSARAAGVLLQLLSGRITSEAARLAQKWPDGFA